MVRPERENGRKDEQPPIGTPVRLPCLLQSPEGEQGQQGIVIQYNIIFDDEQQQESWFKFIKWLKSKYPEAETIAQRLQLFIESLDLHVKI